MDSEIRSERNCEIEKNVSLPGKAFKTLKEKEGKLVQLMIV